MPSDIRCTTHIFCIYKIQLYLLLYFFILRHQQLYFIPSFCSVSFFRALFYISFFLFRLYFQLFFCIFRCTISGPFFISSFPSSSISFYVSSLPSSPLILPIVIQSVISDVQFLCAPSSYFPW